MCFCLRVNDVVTRKRESWRGRPALTNTSLAQMWLLFWPENRQVCNDLNIFIRVKNHMTQADIIRALKIINSFPSHTTRPRGVQQGFFFLGGGSRIKTYFTNFKKMDHLFCTIPHNCTKVIFFWSCTRTVHTLIQYLCFPHTCTITVFISPLYNNCVFLTSVQTKYKWYA